MPALMPSERGPQKRQPDYKEPRDFFGPANGGEEHTADNLQSNHCDQGSHPQCHGGLEDGRKGIVNHAGQPQHLLDRCADTRKIVAERFAIAFIDGHDGLLKGDQIGIINNRHAGFAQFFKL